MSGLPEGIDWSKVPSMLPPDGVESNFINPETNSNVALIVISILLPLTLIFVSLRAYCNFYKDRSKAYSDYACIVAMAASISFISVMYWTISQHLIGRHMWDVPVSMNTNIAVQNFMVIAILYGITIFIAKLSVLLLYLELFTVHSATRIMVYIAIALIVGQCLTNTIGNAVLCVPLPGHSWLVKTATHECIVVADQLGIGLGAVSIFTDFYILFIPIPVIWNLQLATRKKVGVSLIFITGIFACVASILALIYRIRQYQSGDNTWNSGYTYMLCAVEINVTIMCSCMPSFAPYVRVPLQSLSKNFRSLGSTVGRVFGSGSGRSKISGKYSGSMPLEDFESEHVANDKMHLTVGSSPVRTPKGKPLNVNVTTETSIWPMEGTREADALMERRREAWDQQASSNNKATISAV